MALVVGSTMASQVVVAGTKACSSGEGMLAALACIKQAVSTPSATVQAMFGRITAVKVVVGRLGHIAWALVAQQASSFVAMHTFSAHNSAARVNAILVAGNTIVSGNRRRWNSTSIADSDPYNLKMGTITLGKRRMDTAIAISNIVVVPTSVGAWAATHRQAIAGTTTVPLVDTQLASTTRRFPHLTRGLPAPSNIAAVRMSALFRENTMASGASVAILSLWVARIGQQLAVDRASQLGVCQTGPQPTMNQSYNRTS